MARCYKFIAIILVLDKGRAVMKNFVLSIFILTIVVFFVAVCDMAGGISLDEVESELTRYVASNEAKLIVRKELGVDENLLLRVSTNNLSSEAITILLLHPLFPQWRRNELIAEGRDGFYLGNACLNDGLTDEDVQHWLKRFFVSESLLEQALKCKKLSERSKNAIRLRIRNSFSYRMRALFNTNKGHGL